MLAGDGVGTVSMEVLAGTIAVVDDFQQVGENYFPLSDLRKVCELHLTLYTDAADDDGEPVRRAGASEVVIVMRERYAVPRSVIEALERPKPLIASGSRNGAIDLCVARDNGIAVGGTGGSDSAPAELTWRVLLAIVRRLPAEHHSIHVGSLGHRCGGDPGRHDAGNRGTWGGRNLGGDVRQRVRHGRPSPEPQSDTGRGRGVGLSSGFVRVTASRVPRCDASPDPE